MQRYEDYRNNNEKNRMTKQRILQIIENKGLTKTTFFQKTGLKRGFLDSDKLEQAVTDRQIAMIIATFPDINPDWLITGEGEMLRQEGVSTSDNATLSTLLQRIEDLARENGQLKAENEMLKKEIAHLERVASAAPATAASA